MTAGDGWVVSKVKYLADYLNGLAFTPDEWGDQGLRIVRIENLTDPSAPYNRSDTPVDPKYIIFKGDILISWSASLHVHLWRDEEPAVLNQHIFKATPRKDRIDPAFFYWLATWFIGELEGRVHGSTMQHLTWDRFGGFSLRHPSDLAHQHTIAAFLDRETTKIDTLIAKKERLLALLEEKRTALITRAVTKGLDPTVPMKASGAEWLGEVPAHWKIPRNKLLLREVKDLSVDGSEELLTVSHITGVTPRAEKEVFMFMAETTEGYKRCLRDDVVVNTMWAYMGALGVAPRDGIVSPSYNVYRLREDAFESSYFDLLCRTPGYVAQINQNSEGVWRSRLRLYPEAFLELLTPVPPREEQGRIVGHVRETEARERPLRAALVRSTALLREYRTALISAAVTGQVDVSAVAEATGEPATRRSR